MTVIAIPRILQEKLTPEGAEALVEIINKADERSKENIIELSEERFEKRLAQLDGKIEKVAAEFDAKIERVKAELLKWMFIFWVGQIGVLTGIMFAFFRK